MYNGQVDGYVCVCVSSCILAPGPQNHHLIRKSRRVICSEIHWNNFQCWTILNYVPQGLCRRKCIAPQNRERKTTQVLIDSKDVKATLIGVSMYKGRVFFVATQWTHRTFPHPTKVLGIRWSGGRSLHSVRSVTMEMLTCVEQERSDVRVDLMFYCVALREHFCVPSLLNACV